MSTTQGNNDPKKPRVATRVDPQNIVAATMDDLSEEQKSMVRQAGEEYQKLLLGSFHVSRRGHAELVKELPSPATRNITITEDGQMFQDMIDKGVNFALINQSTVLQNLVENSVTSTMKSHLQGLDIRLLKQLFPDGPKGPEYMVYSDGKGKGTTNANDSSSGSQIFPHSAPTPPEI